MQDLGHAGGDLNTGRRQLGGGGTQTSCVMLVDMKDRF